MEKLIELLNKYKKIKGYDGNTKITNYYTDTGSFTNGYSGLEYEIVIGKRYGFIQWLVDNEKIDIKALVVKGEMRSGWDFDNKKGNEESGEEIWNKYYSELCLMLLAIQDEPIRFLISILK